MNAHVRRKLDMAGRVRDFNRQHMAEDASYATILVSFETRLARAEALARQQRSGRISSRAATGRRRELRATLHEKLLPYLVRVGQALAKTEPEVGQRFEMPSRRLANAIYRTAARAMYDEAAAARMRFVAAGLTEPFLSDLGDTLDAYDQAVEHARLARIAHVGARAELDVVTEELMDLVALLDGLNRYRFRNNAELDAAWVSARNVVGSRRPAVPTPSTPAPPLEEEAVKPAA